MSRVIAEAQRRFELYTSGKDKAAVHPNLRAAIFGIAIRYGGATEFAALRKEWQTTKSVDGKEICLAALARIQTPELLSEFLSLMFNEVATQDLHTGANGLANNPKTRHGFWEYVKQNFDTIRARLGENMVVMNYFIRYGLNSFTDRETEKDITDFFAKKDNSGYDRALGLVLDTVRARASYRERDGAAILEWLKANGHA